MIDIMKRTNIELGDTAFLDMTPQPNGGVLLTMREGRIPRASMILSKQQTVFTIKALVKLVGGTVEEKGLIR